MGAHVFALPRGSSTGRGSRPLAAGCAGLRGLPGKQQVGLPQAGVTPAFGGALSGVPVGDLPRGSEPPGSVSVGGGLPCGVGVDGPRSPAWKPWSEPAGRCEPESVLDALWGSLVSRGSRERTRVSRGRSGAQGPGEELTPPPLIPAVHSAQTLGPEDRHRWGGEVGSPPRFFAPPRPDNRLLPLPRRVGHGVSAGPTGGRLLLGPGV